MCCKQTAGKLDLVSCNDSLALIRLAFPLSHSDISQIFYSWKHSCFAVHMCRLLWIQKRSELARRFMKRGPETNTRISKQWWNSCGHSNTTNGSIISTIINKCCIVTNKNKTQNKTIRSKAKRKQESHDSWLPGHSFASRTHLFCYFMEIYAKYPLWKLSSQCTRFNRSIMPLKQ